MLHIRNLMEFGLVIDNHSQNYNYVWKFNAQLSILNVQ